MLNSIMSENILIGKGEYVLVVDDSRETVQHLAQSLLPTHGFRATYALDGQSALQKIREESPDLVMLDLNLPQMTGLDVLEALVLEENHPPVVMMTGGGSEQIAVEAFRLGVRDYLVKPFTVNEVITTIRRALDYHHSGEDARLNAAQNEVRRQKEHFDRLLHISKKITAITDFSAIVDKVLDTVVKEFNAEHALLILPDANLHEQMLTYQRNAHEETTSLWPEAPPDPYVAEVIERGHNIRQADFSDGFNIGLEHHARALLYVPINFSTSSGDLRGVLGISNTRKPLAFSRLDEIFLSAIGNYTSIALTNSMDLQDSRLHESERIEALYEIANFTQSLVTQPADNVIRDVIVHTFERWNVQACSIWIVDEEHQQLNLYSNIGLGEDALAGMSLPLGTGFVGRVALTGRWTYKNDVQGDPRHYDMIDKKTGFKTRSLLCVPLIYQDEILGALQLVNRVDGDFTPEDIEDVTSITTILAIALNYMRLDQSGEPSA